MVCVGGCGCQTIGIGARLVYTIRHLSVERIDGYIVIDDGVHADRSPVVKIVGPVSLRKQASQLRA